jgi:hypothetical protein
LVTARRVLLPRVAVAEIVKVAVTVVSFTTVTPLAVTPTLPVTVIAVVPVSPLPVRVTATVLPRKPVFGAIEVSVGTVTVNGTELLVAPVVVTVTVLAPNPALAEIAKLAVTVVSFTTVIPLIVTPPPDTVIAVVPVRPVPVRVTGMVAPRVPVFGAIEVNVGFITVTVNGTELVVAPPALVTVRRVLLPRVAVAEIVKVAVTVVSFTTVTPFAVTPTLPVTLIFVAPVSPVPVRVTATVLPREPVFGAIEVNVGPVTVNGTELLVAPPGLVTASRVLLPRVAVAEIVKVAVTVVSFSTVTPLAVTPTLPVTVIAVVPVSPVPVRVATTVLPRKPVFGAIEVSVSGDPVTVNGTELLVPAGFVTVTVLAPNAAVGAIVKVAVI